MSDTAMPPKLLRRLLKRVLPRYVGEEGLGDFEEEYAARAAERGQAFAKTWYLAQILKSIPPFVRDAFYWGGIILKNSMTITWRDIKKNKVFSSIGIFGLALGLACCVIIMLFVQDELSFDRFNVNADRIFRVATRMSVNGQDLSQTRTKWTAGPRMAAEFPGVEDYIRISPSRGYVLEYGDLRVITDPHFADPGIFKVFSFPFVLGDPDTALKNPESVVLSEKLAGTVFGRENPMGKVVTVHDQYGKYDLQVRGVFKDIPLNSHLRFDFLAPLSYEENRYRGMKMEAMINTCVTYLLMRSNARPEQISAALPAFVKKTFGDAYASRCSYELQPLTSIHLGSHLALELSENSRLSVSVALGVVALIILLIACVNFINLSTARASRRSREVGLRKSIGAGRVQLFRQFIGESVVLAFLALFIALVLAVMILPVFNSVMNRQLNLTAGKNSLFLAGLMLLTALTGVLSGCYPAIFLSSYQPAEALKGKIVKGTKLGPMLRKGLVVFQFALSLVFIIGTVVVLRQMRFVRAKDLGFDKENVLQISIFQDPALRDKTALIESELGRHAGVRQVIVIDGNPGGYGGFPVPCVPEGGSEDRPVDLNLITVGPGFFDFFGIGVAQGRVFRTDAKAEAQSSVVLNEAAIKALGLKDPIGKQIRGGEMMQAFAESAGPFIVIGVVKDFHNGSLHENIRPAVYICKPGTPDSIYVKVAPGSVPTTISFLREAWKKIPTHLLFQVNFLDDLLDKQYRNDDKVQKVFMFSSVLAVGLACLGLFGLTLYTAERRKKEIGIRKIIGASASKIVLMLSKDFARPVLLANVIAWPAGYYVGKRWLQNFAFRIDIGWWIFVLAAAAVFLIAFLTISVQAVRAASANPADVLRHE